MIKVDYIIYLIAYTLGKPLDNYYIQLNWQEEGRYVGMLNSIFGKIFVSQNEIMKEKTLS
jgi:hypothetical protein